MCEDAHVKEQWQLLQSLRTTVESLLVDGILNVWNVYGGLNRFHSVMERIFKHGCRIFNRNHHLYMINWYSCNQKEQHYCAMLISDIVENNEIFYKGEPDCWIFIQGLNWLQPSLAVSPVLSEIEDYLSNLPARITSQKDMLWLYKSLENHSLSHKLSWLLSDKEHLLSCFEPWAFLCQENFSEATLLCLRAVERNQPALLTEIDPSLYLPSWISPKSSPRRHRRSSSYPINFPTTNFNAARDKSIHIGICQLESLKIALDNTVTRRNDTEPEETNHKTDLKDINDIPLKTWNSLSALTKNCTVSGTNPPAPSSAVADTISHKSNDSTCSVELSKIINVNYADLKQSAPTIVGDKLHAKPRTPLRKAKNKAKMRQNQTTKRSEKSPVALNYEDSTNRVTEYRIPSPVSTETDGNKCTPEPAGIDVSVKPRKKSSFLPGSAPEFTGPWSLEIEGQKDIRTPKKSFMEDGGSSVQPMAIGYFPRPTEGQSLTSFLASAQFSRANAELDRENAHFSVSEAMIAAIEQVKCNRQWRLMEEADEESDEEINSLKQRIRLRRRQRQEERCKGRTWNRDLLSDGRTDTTTTDQSISPLSTSSDTPSENISTDDVEDLEADDERNVVKLKIAALSVSMASLYSEAADLFESSPVHGTESTLTESSMSAEGVALSLISRFSEKQLPRASELQWLVSEKDAPQRLLPLPKSWPVSPDEAENLQSVSLRGTTEWAPPRPQIIFTPHPPPVRRTLIAKQNYRCAGCGMKVAVKYANKFRYCEYVGRYFCTGCHTNQVALIPGKILSKWDFNRYPVSNFSYRLLDQMTLDPLFQVSDLNPLLYRRIKQLDRTRLLRTQLFFFKDFLFTCRFATSVQKLLKKEPNYILSDPHVYSIQDLMHVKYGILPMRLQELVQVCNMHIIGCELCQARGFLCELCCSKDVIFPWELSKISRCETCGACFHNECKQDFNKTDCPRCIRLQARRMSREGKF